MLSSKSCNPWCNTDKATLSPQIVEASAIATAKTVLLVRGYGRIWNWVWNEFKLVKAVRLPKHSGREVIGKPLRFNSEDWALKHVKILCAASVLVAGSSCMHSSTWCSNDLGVFKAGSIVCNTACAHAAKASEEGFPEGAGI